MARFEAWDDVPSKAEELDGITPASGTCAAGVATEAERSFASQEPRCEDVPSCEEVSCQLKQSSARAALLRGLASPQHLCPTHSCHL